MWKMKAKKREAAFGLCVALLRLECIKGRCGKERTTERPTDSVGRAKSWRTRGHSRGGQSARSNACRIEPDDEGSGGAEECFENHLARKRDEISAGDEARETSS
jgi:hypothetical protein